MWNYLMKNWKIFLLKSFFSNLFNFSVCFLSLINNKEDWRKTPFIYTGRSGGKFEKETDIQILFPSKVNFGLQLNNPKNTKSLSMCYSMCIFTLWLANLRLGLPACQSFIYQVLQTLIFLSTRIDNVRWGIFLPIKCFVEKYNIEWTFKFLSSWKTLEQYLFCGSVDVISKHSSRKKTV